MLSKLQLPLLFVLTAFVLGCGFNHSNNIEHDIVINEFYIECEPDAFNKLYADFNQNNYIPITISFQGDTTVAKMRIRGDTSREDPKKSLKIKFDSTGIASLPDKLNLNAEYSDKTYIRQYLSSLLMSKSKQICFQSAFAKVFLNGQFFGLYLQVENMDKDFLKRNGLDPEGNLYKATKDGACLSIFDDFEEKWEKKTNKKSDHNDLTELIHQINHVSDQDFENFLKNTFEYDQLINTLALNMMLSNSSTYYHNYYLYHDLYTTGKWQLLPWDMDKTLSYYNWMPYTYHRTSSEWESDNPLIERSLLCEPVFNDIKSRINDLYATYLNNEALSPFIDNLIQALRPIVPMDSTDQLQSEDEWLYHISQEKKYFNNHYQLLQNQFNTQPHSFYVYRFDQIQTGPITFKWQKAKHPANKKITYILSYGTDFLLKDSTKTNYIEAISDTFYSMKELLPEGVYYWKVTAFDGDHYTDGFNTKNRFEVKMATPLPNQIASNLKLSADQSPYLASSITTILQGAELTLEKGVEIHLPKGAIIECFGNIIANGTALDPIEFMPQNAHSEWGDLNIKKTSTKVHLKHVIFEEGVMNCEGKTLSMDSCSMLVDKKDMGKAENRKVLIFANYCQIHIANSTFISNGYGEGMVLFNSDVITENCYFDNTPDAIEYIGSNQGVIRNNLVTNAPDDAIDLNHCNNILIEGNMLFNNHDKAISVGTEQYGASLKNIQIKNNLIVNNNIGIALKDSSVALMSNNTLFKNTHGILAYKKREDYLIGGYGEVKNTIFEKNQESDVKPDAVSKIQVNHSISNSNMLTGVNNLQGDPKFIDAKHNNFHLMPESICLKKGEDGSDLGAFQSFSTTVGLAQIHLKSSKTKNTGDYIEIINHFNLPVDLSLYKILIIQNNETKAFVFPIGTQLDRLGSLFITDKYFDFISVYKTAKAIGGLPKLNNVATTIKLLNAEGFVLDEFVYQDVTDKAESLTFRSNRLNDNRKKTWSLESE